MRQVITFAAIIASVGAAGAQGRDPRQARIDNYVVAFVRANFAASDCGSTVNMGALAMIRSAAKIKETEESYVDHQIQAATRVTITELKERGTAAWCAAATELYGPRGTQARGLITPR